MRKCPTTVSRRIAAALWHEERRVHYLSDEARIMTLAQDDAAGLGGADESGLDSAFHPIMQRSQLARDLCRIYEASSFYEELKSSIVLESMATKRFLGRQTINEQVLMLR